MNIHRNGNLMNNPEDT